MCKNGEFAVFRKLWNPQWVFKPQFQVNLLRKKDIIFNTEAAEVRGSPVEH